MACGVHGRHDQLRYCGVKESVGEVEPKRAGVIIRSGRVGSRMCERAPTADSRVKLRRGDDGGTDNEGSVLDVVDDLRPEAFATGRGRFRAGILCASQSYL